MKYIFSFFTIALFLLGACNTPVKTNNNTNEVKQDSNPAKAVYACPMHPEEKSDKPGACPKCGMDLEKQ